MKCIVLAAGRGIRMMPLTKGVPKPLLKINGIPIIDYVLYYLPKEINEIIIVVDYLGEQIKSHIGNKHDGIKVTYVQGSDKGNAYSFLATKKYLKKEKFLLIYGDEMPNAENIGACMDEGLSVLTYGEDQIDGVMVLNTDIFRCKPDIDFVDMVKQFIKSHEVKMIKAENFIGGINTPDDIKRVEGILNG